MVSGALRSFWAEPPAPDPPARVWWDWPLVVVLVVGGILEAALREDMPARGVALVVAVTPVLLLWRRTRPLPVTVALFGVNVLGDAITRIATGEPLELYASVYVLLLPYELFRWGAGRDAVVGMAFVLASHATLSAADGAWGDIALGIPFLLLPGALGASIRYRASSRQRETDQVKLLEREQLARELHDTVAHHVSAIAIQAQAGRAVAGSQPEAAVRALEVIEEAASRTLEELRGLVDALRQGEEPELAPQRGVADIARLAGTAGDGPAVEVELSGDLDGLRPLVGAAIYRIAQESITNAMRHARHATRVDVRVVADGDLVRLTVCDDGEAGASDGASGYGLVGMTERAALLGGTLDAGPAAEGWTVSAVLPRNGTPA